MNKRLIIVAVAAILAMQMQAVIVDNRAGRLGDILTDLTVTTLKVNGTMNAKDFYFISDQLHQLQTLDLTDVRIEPSTTAEQHYWTQEFAADVIPVGALADMNLTKVVMPQRLTAIGKGAFAGCTSLVDVSLPATLDSIADYAFAGCTSLKTMTLPANVRTVGYGAFMRCTSLESFTVEASSRLAHLEATALMDCPSLATLSLGNALRSVGERALAGTGITQVDFSQSRSLTDIDDWAMVKTPLTSAKLPSSLSHVGDGVFLYDTSLAEVNLGGRLAGISDYLFAGTSLADGLDLTGVKTLGDYAMYNVSTLSVVELPATVTWLGTQAMAGMTGLTALTSNAEEVPSLGQDVWLGVNQAEIPLTVPSAALRDYKAAEQWKNFYFEPEWIRGDVNGDGAVNIADINALIGIILGRQADEQTMLRADVNGDGAINIADINAVIAIILNPQSNVPASSVDTDDALHMADELAIKPGETRTVNIVLDNAANYSALQCDIVLPQGLTLVDAKPLAEREKETCDLDNATSRTLVYSMDKAPFEDKAVLSITLLADASLPTDAFITLSNIVLADENDVAWHAADCIARVTNSSGIDDLTAQDGRVWIEGRSLCIEASHDGTARIVAVNGTARSMTFMAGVSRHEMEPGIYVVVVDGKSYKIAIK